MSKIRNIFGLSKKDKDRSDQLTPADSNGRGTSDSHSRGQPIDNGIYIITNVRHHRFVYLEDPNDNTTLRGYHRPGNRNAQWHVRSWGNEQYSIENLEHNRYAYCGPLAGLKASVEGHGSEQLWRIQARPTGEYTIATTDTRNMWMLPYDDPGTPVELFNVSTDPRCWWTFKRPEIGASVNENDMIQPVPFKPRQFGTLSGDQRTPDLRSSSPHTLDPYQSGLLISEPPPRTQRSRDRAIVSLKLVWAITEATGLVRSLEAARGALKVVLDRAKNIHQADEGWQKLIGMLEFHFATVKNHLVKLEDDRKIDGDTLDLDQAIREPLETYARELEETYQLVLENQPKSLSLLHMITYGNRNMKLEISSEKMGNIDEPFRTYTAALHLFAASTITRMQPEFPEFHRDFLKDTKKMHLKVSNAYGVQHVPCVPGTRLKTLQAIRNWVDSESDSKPIFFLLDVAGSGKSTVAKHMAEEWTGQRRLLARFFFSRDTTETMSTKAFCSTVAGAFADLDPHFKIHMDKFMLRPNAGLLSFEQQFEGLVANPLRALNKHAIITIDALDECHNEYGNRDQLLETLRAQQSSLPLLRILATGRPERDIKHWAKEKFGFGYANFIQLEGGHEDVAVYIKLRLQHLPTVQDRLYPVIQHAEGLFIWARIACDLLVNSDDVDGLLEELGKEVSLDYLYGVALQQSMPKDVASRRAMVMVLQMILAAREPLSIAELENAFAKAGCRRESCHSPGQRVAVPRPRRSHPVASCDVPGVPYGTIKGRYLLHTTRTRSSYPCIWLPECDHPCIETGPFYFA